MLIAEFDRRETWGGEGIKSSTHWLNYKGGLSMGLARRKVRVARALEAARDRLWNEHKNVSAETPSGFKAEISSDRSLESINQQTGLDITPETAIPNWHYGNMDLHMAVSGLYEATPTNGLE